MKIFENEQITRLAWELPHIQGGGKVLLLSHKSDESDCISPAKEQTAIIKVSLTPAPKAAPRNQRFLPP